MSDKREDGFWYALVHGDVSIVKVHGEYVYFVGCKVRDSFARFEEQGYKFIHKVKPCEQTPEGERTTDQENLP